MRPVWIKLLISAFVAFGITAGTAYVAMPHDAPITYIQLMVIIVGGALQALTVIQKGLDTVLPDGVAK